MTGLPIVFHCILLQPTQLCTLNCPVRVLHWLYHIVFKSNITAHCAFWRITACDPFPFIGIVFVYLCFCICVFVFVYLCRITACVITAESALWRITACDAFPFIGIVFVFVYLCLCICVSVFVFLYLCRITACVITACSALWRITACDAFPFIGSQRTWEASALWDRSQVAFVCSVPSPFCVDVSKICFFLIYFHLPNEYDRPWYPNLLHHLFTPIMIKSYDGGGLSKAKNPQWR